jgi:hypothetical protein
MPPLERELHRKANRIATKIANANPAARATRLIEGRRKGRLLVRRQKQGPDFGPCHLRRPRSAMVQAL